MQREPGGSFLKDIRKGSMSSENVDRAPSIVRRVLADPRDAIALAHLEACFRMCTEKRDECLQRVATSRAKKCKRKRGD